MGNIAYFVRYIKVEEDRKAHEEVEGLTIWDVDGKGMPGINGGQIHCVVLDNDANQDDVTLRHYAVNWKGGL